MPVLKLTQLQYESDTWRRLIEFMINENIQLKNRVSDILKNGFDKSQLDVIESFHDGFIKEDELISLVRNEVAELNNLVSGDNLESEQPINIIQEKLIKIRNNIATAEKNLGELQTGFNNYMLGFA